MKNLTVFILFLFIGFELLAQSPHSFRYQAVARDNSGNLLSNQSVSFRISILSGSVSGTTTYSEIHYGISTNNFGLVGLEIGKGTPTTGTFSLINWGNDSYYVKVEMDPAGGTAYQVLSTSQLLSVPFALHANTVQNGDNWGTQTVEIDADLSGDGTTSSPLKIAQQSATAGQVLKWNGTTWSPDSDLSGSSLWSQNEPNIYYSSGYMGLGTNTPSTYIHAHGSPVSSRGQLSLSAPSGEGAFMSFYDADIFKAYLHYDVGDEDLRLQNFTAGDLNLNPYGGNVGIGTNEPGAALEVVGQLKITGGTPGVGKLLTSDATGLATWETPIDAVNDADSNPLNEIQELSLTGTNLSLSESGGTVSLSPFVSPWTTSGSNIYRSAGNIGIGTTSPLAPLHLYANRDALFGSSFAGNGAKLIWDYSSRALRAGYAAASSWNEDSIGLYSTAFGFGTVAQAYMSFADGFYTHARTYAGFSIGRYNVGAAGNQTSWTTSDPLFEVGNGTSNSNRNNAFTIRKDGRVGINDATPDYLLDIENNDLSLRSIYINHDNTISSSTLYGIYVNADNNAANSGVSYAAYFDMTNTNDDAYGLYSLAFCDATDGSPAYAVRSYVDNDNGSGWAYSIYGSVAGSTTGAKYAGYFNGNVYTTGSYLPSDKKLKTNIQPTAENATHRLMQLQVTNFEYLKSTFIGMNLPQGPQTGFLAQDVEELFPELVKEAVQPGPTPEEIKKGALPAADVTFKAVDYTRLIPHLLKAFQEQQAEIEVLKQRIAQLEK